MSFIQNLGKFARYTTSNYAMKNNICKKKLDSEINNFLNNPPNISSVINGVRINDKYTHTMYSPSYNRKKIFTYQYLDSDKKYSIVQPSDSWKRMSPELRLQIFTKIADLVENKYFYKMMAATMVGQGKNTYESQLDCIAEMVDFLRFNIQYTAQIFNKQPNYGYNYSQYNPLQGNVLAITPFNFTAIAGNLATAPLYFGNNVIWKPSEKSLLSNWVFYEICKEAGVPDDCLHFCIMKPNEFIESYMDDNVGGVLYTGSTNGFQNILSNVSTKKHFPRIIGETGGKNFHFVEKTAPIDLVVEKTFQSAFNYSGQKCSACSILYLPESMLDDFITKMKNYKKKYNFENYGVIDKESYYKTVNIITKQKDNINSELLMGGNFNIDSSFFIEPTIFRIDNKDEPILKEELFAPILCIRTYEDDNLYDAVCECKHNSEYKLTGAIFSRNKHVIEVLTREFDSNTGNFYINDKSTGALVGQQPFGGFGLSGTNDKAGDINFLYRLFNQRNVKVNLNILYNSKEYN